LLASYDDGPINAVLKLREEKLGSVLGYDHHLTSLFVLAIVQE
jgi:hypothetical protein